MTAARRSPVQIVLWLVLDFTLVFALPFHIPVAPAVSDSYTFGFNNRAALILFLLFSFSFAYWSGGLGLVAAAPDDAPADPPLSRRLLAVTLAITTALTVMFWMAYHSVGAINEGAYLLDRLQHFAAGERIFRDFEFIYGPLILAIPWILHVAFRLSLVDAYYLAWVLDWVGGVILLWLTVKWACRSSPRKNGIYLLAYLGFIFSIVSLGLNYTPLRFVSAPFFATASWRLLQQKTSPLPAALLCLLGAAWTLFLSPEQGLAFCAATLLFFLVFVDRSRPGYRAALVLLAGSDALLVWLWLQLGAAHSMRGMAQGGYNLPLLPGLNTILLLLLLLAAFCVLVNSLRLRRAGGPLEYLVLIALCACPSAFGRCDAGHLFMNTLGAYLAAWTVLSYRPQAGRWMVWSYVAGALFLPLALYQANNFVMFPVKMALFAPANPHPALRSFTLSLLRKRLGERRAEATLAKWRMQIPLATPSNLPHDQQLLAPLGFPSTLLLGELPPITNGRFRGLGNVITKGEVQEKVAEMQDHPAALLLMTEAASCPPPGETASAVPSAAARAAEDTLKRKELFLNLLPFYVPHVRHREDLLAPVCAYITTHYRPAPYSPPLLRAQVLERISP